MSRHGFRIASILAVLFSTLWSVGPGAQAHAQEVTPTGVAPASAIDAGSGHTCGLTTTGAVKCWGGDGATGMRWAPVFVSDLSSGVSAIFADFGQTCAVTSAGAPKCWGFDPRVFPENPPTTGTVSTPSDVFGITGGVIAAGDSHMCALNANGTVDCVGDNLYGQFGVGQIGRTGYVVNRSLLPRVRTITAGENHTCALLYATGGVTCWGNNDHGQVGSGAAPFFSVPSPADVSGLSSGVSAIAAGVNHTCAVTSAGGVKCWGNNEHGQLGDGTTTNRVSPVDVSGLSSGVTAISAGFTQTCALTSGGAVKCWGGNRSDGTTPERLTPFAVSGLSSGVSAITAGHYHGCALMNTGGVKCWGINNPTAADMGGVPTPVVAAQAVTFTSTPPADPRVGGSYTATATGGASGNPVIFSLDASSGAGVCTVTSDGTVSFTAVGNCVIAANQSGNADFTAAPTATQVVVVSKVPQTIDFPHPGAKSLGDPPFTVSATASSGLPVSFGVASGPCTIAGSTVTITGVGTCVIAADQGGNTDFSAAPQVTRSVAVAQSAQTIMFTDPGPHTFGDAPFAVSATASSGLPVSFGVASGPCTIAGSTVTITGVGTCVIAADQAGNTDFSAAARVTRDVMVNRAALTITASDATATYGHAPPAVTPSYSGFVNGDGASALSPVPTCGVGASATSPAGTYVTSCSGAVAANYAIAYVNGTLTVDKAPLTVTASDATATYGDTPPAVTPRYGGFVNGEGPAALSVAPTCTPGGSPSTPAGTHSGATSCSGAAAANYAIGYVNGTLTVDKRPLDLTANDASKVYGQDVPTLTATLSGFVNGDPATVVSGNATLTTTATATSKVGTYPITVTPGTLTAANYTFTPRAGTLTVTPAPLTVTASSATMVLKGTPPTITADFTGLVGGDTSGSEQAKATCSTTATPESQLGTYPTTCTLADPNYTPTYVAGTLQVTYGIKVVHDQTAAHRSGSNVPLKVQLVDATGKNLSSSTTVLTLSTPALSRSPNPGAQPTGTFSFLQTKDNGPMYQLDIKTTGFPTGTYTLTFVVAGDPAPHTARFVIG